MGQALQIAAGYGSVGIVALLIIVGIAWMVAHIATEPGTRVKVLWGLVEYQKRYPRRRKKRPIVVSHKATGTLWRIKHPLREWADNDLSSYGSTGVDDLIDGPYHAPCKRDLSYFGVDENGTGPKIRRVRRVCRTCEAIVIPDNVGNVRADFKQHILLEIQRLHMDGKKIKSGTAI